MVFRRLARFVPCAVAALALVPAVASAAPPVLQPGTYVGVNRAGSVMRGDLANTIVIVRGADGSLRFSVTAYRQADAKEGDPSYKLPTVIIGTLPHASHSMTWATKGNDRDHNVSACLLTFTADGSQALVLRQNESTCALGPGVIAAGRYLRTSTRGTLAQPFFHE